MQSKLQALLISGLTVVCAYSLARGMTLFLVVPIQTQFLPEITAFAALVYLPHGVRILAPWLMGWAAIPALFLGAWLSHVLLTPDTFKNTLGPQFLLAILFSEVTGVIALWLMTLTKKKRRTQEMQNMRWPQLLIAALIASAINSCGLALVYSGRLPEDWTLTLVIYALGDVIGFAVCLLCLMFVFRMIRRSKLFEPEQL